MSAEFSLIPIEHLCRWILAEEAATGQIFGIHRDQFFTPRTGDPFTMQRYGEILSTPVGVAAGPHTQMAQNLIAAWLCGARYLELKTVQTLDELKVSKPCIDMQDEGYNCEWSQELRLDDSFNEYLNAWVLIHVLQHKFGWREGTHLGCLFNMSVGYNMEGILKDNVQRFLARMDNCHDELRAKIDAVAQVYPGVRDIEIPARMSDNITLSTMHGCPPDEIEKIGAYLIRDRKLHTTVKLNPTLLGPTELRRILNDKLGFATHVPDEAFGHDLKYPDAVKLITNLRALARENNVQFSLKLTNTLESVNHKSVFPANEKMMYMSGRALHPISINVARKLQHDFNGELDVSFSAGADCFNLPQIIAAGIKPITVCSDILKPGGYARMRQYLDELRHAITKSGAKNIDEFIVRHGRHGNQSVAAAALANLEQYAVQTPELPLYRRDHMQGEIIKTERVLTTFDCVAAPCVNTCPTNQDIPQYLYHTSRGEYREAMDVILRTNPFPNVCGMVCDHLCQTKCTRINYDSPLLIREIKRFVTTRPNVAKKPAPAPANGLKAVIIGAGPSGLACAYFLALGGFAVNVYETKAFAGGMVADAIPAFRLTNEAIKKDIEFITSIGVQVHYNAPVDKASYKKITKDADYIYIAVGAQAAKKMGIPHEDAAGVIDCLRFLSDVRQGKKVALGKKVVIVGGGNSAMDAARTALRLVGKGGEVTVVYRRTRKEMPADLEEIHALLAEGIQIAELVAPAEVKLDKSGRVTALVADRMRLGAKDASGRARPEKVPNSRFEIACDSIIPAIGQDVVAGFLDGKLEVNETTYQTQLPKVYAGGDAMRGAATIIKAVGDGRRVAGEIQRAAKLEHGTAIPHAGKDWTQATLQQKRAHREFGRPVPETPLSDRGNFDLVTKTLTENEARTEANRCLLCDEVCNVCVSVCPNRANVAWQAKTAEYDLMKAVRQGGVTKVEKTGEKLRFTQVPQVLNIGDFCNECGNCTTFCPTSGAPFKDKPKFYLTRHSFDHETDGYHFADGSTLLARHGGVTSTLRRSGGKLYFEHPLVTATLDGRTLAIEEATLAETAGKTVDLSVAATMAVLLTSLGQASFV